MTFAYYFIHRRWKSWRKVEGGPRPHWYPQEPVDSAWRRVGSTAAWDCIVIKQI